MADATTVAVSVAQPEHVTVNVVASAPAAAAVTTPSADAQAAATTSAEPSAKEQAPQSKSVEPTAAAAPAASNPGATTAKQDGRPSTGTSASFQRQGDDFYNTIFYFSGMGSVIGNALAQGVYVSEQNRRNAIDPDDVAAGKQGAQTDQLVVNARGQAQNLSTDFHKLQGLLDSLPVFTGGSSVSAAERRGQELDRPIHGELYFRCKERFPVQPSPTPTAGRQRDETGGGVAVAAPRARAADPVEADRSRRRQHDDAVLADVARAAAEAFPLLPPPRGTGSTPSSSGRPSPSPYGGDPGRRERRRPQQQGEWASESTTTVDVKPWQMSHVRQFDVVDGYPLDRP